MHQVSLGKKPYKQRIYKARLALEILNRVAVIECKEVLNGRVAHFKKQRAEGRIARHDRPQRIIVVRTVEARRLIPRQKRVQILVEFERKFDQVRSEEHTSELQS